MEDAPGPFESAVAIGGFCALSLAKEQTTVGASAALATQAVVLAAVANTLLKAGLAISLGSRGLKLRIAVVLGATAAVGAGWLLLVR